MAAGYGLLKGLWRHAQNEKRNLKKIIFKSKSGEIAVQMSFFWNQFKLRPPNTQKVCLKVS